MERREARRMKKAIAVVSLVLMAGLVFSLVGLAQHGLAELHVQKIVLEPPSSVTDVDILFPL